MASLILSLILMHLFYIHCTCIHTNSMLYSFVHYRSLKNPNSVFMIRFNLHVLSSNRNWRNPHQTPILVFASMPGCQYYLERGRYQKTFLLSHLQGCPIQWTAPIIWESSPCGIMLITGSTCRTALKGSRSVFD